MFRNLADCVETLEDAGSRFYTISGTGVNLSYAPDDEATATPEACLQRFERDFNKLGPGRYGVTHKKASAANRNPATFSFYKTVEGAALGSTASPDGYALTDMQLKIQQIQHENEIYRLKRDHADELARLKSKENQPDGTDKFLNMVGQLNQLAINAKNLPAPASVAGTPGQTLPPATPAARAVPVDEQDAVVNDTVQALHDALGGDDAVTLDVLRKIGNVAKNNPEQIQSIVNFL